MIGTIGELLPVALGVAISPMPIIAVIVMMFGKRPVPAAVSFAVGWIIGVTATTGIVMLVATPVEESAAPPVWVSVVKLLFGVLFLLMAVKQWRGRPRGDEEPQMPGWMAAVDSMTPVKSAGLAAFLAGVNPKNLALCAAAGTVIGSAGLSAGGAIGSLVIFVALASVTVVGPVLAFLLARRKIEGALNNLRTWLIKNNAPVMTVLLLVLGVNFVGQGIGGL